MSSEAAPPLPSALSPWLTRADEVAPHFPRVAYYLRLHAAQEGLRSGAPPAALAALLARLEKDKPRAGLQGAAADARHCAEFADKVFARADARVRPSRAAGGAARGAGTAPTHGSAFPRSFLFRFLDAARAGRGWRGERRAGARVLRGGAVL